MRNNEFLLELERRFTSMQQYEDKRLQQKALSQLPLLKFEEKAQERMRALQKQVKKGNFSNIDLPLIDV